MAIPPGPQIPFDPKRKYGQSPGFVSRHSGKIFIGVIILILALIAFFSITVLLSDDNDDFSSLIGDAELTSGEL